MRHAFAVAVAALAVLTLSACESTGGYDGVSRFAGAGGMASHYYGPGSPPRDFGGGGSHS